MQTPDLFLFFFLLTIISATAFTVAEIGHVVRTLKARLDRQDAAEAKQRQNPNSLNASLVGKVFRKNMEIEALECTIALKDEEIKNLNGDIAKLKFDYAAQVADCNCGKPEFINSPGECKTCIGKGKYRRPYTVEEETCECCNGTGHEDPSAR